MEDQLRQQSCHLFGGELRLMRTRMRMRTKKCHRSISSRTQNDVREYIHSAGYYTESTIPLINTEMWGTTSENRWESANMSCALGSSIHRITTTFDANALLCVILIQFCIHQRFLELCGGCDTIGLVQRTSRSATTGHSIVHELLNRPSEIPRS